MILFVVLIHLCLVSVDLCLVVLCLEKTCEVKGAPHNSKQNFPIKENELIITGINVHVKYRVKNTYFV